MNIILISPTKKYLGSHDLMKKCSAFTSALKQGLTNNGPPTKTNVILLTFVGSSPHPHSEVTYDYFHTTATPAIETV